MPVGAELREGCDLFLQQDLGKELLRFTTAGSVDDGKSTLIGRLLHDAKGVYEDQLASVKRSRINRSGGPIDFSLLTDGLRAEREQGITIDVAYRYFQTTRRKFIIADTPGHEQYTRNMATGASTADLAVILVDGTKGLLPQTRCHTYIASLLGISNVVAAINKMDAMGWREDVFVQLQEEFLELAERLEIPAVKCVPVSALEGDNVVSRSGKMAWYSGPTLLEHLETVPIWGSHELVEARFPVQYVIRPDAAFRGFAGQVASGVVRPGDALMALPSRQITRVESIVTYAGELNAAVRQQSVTLKLEDEIDLSRGDMLVSLQNPPAVSDQFRASLVWLHEKPLELNKAYLVKHTTRQVKAKVVGIQHRVDVNTLALLPAGDLDMNGIALVDVQTSQPLFFDSYNRSRSTGSFILIDPLSNATVGAGMIREVLVVDGPEARGKKLGAANVKPAAVSAEERFHRHGHRPGIFLLPKLESLLEEAERALFESGFETVVVRGEEFAASTLAPILKTLWASGMVILLFKAESSIGTPALQSLAGDSFFALSEIGEHAESEEWVAEILLRAKSLRIAPELWKAKKDH
jgi:sulfate adenylyltransferase large subunit